ncbi:hypothetical protein [Deinococcus sp. UYEF24]
MNRFAHLKDSKVEETVETVPAPLAAVLNAPDPTPAESASFPEEAVPADDLQELNHLVERRIGIVGKIPASVKDAYDEMLLRTRKYIGRPNSDLAVQAWVELTLEDEAFQRRWLKRMQELRQK